MQRCWIQKLIIQNLQSHRSTTIELSDGVNVFVGTSDSGKSAIIRALMLLLFNRGGSSLVSNWGGDLEVIAVLSDGSMVGRRIMSGKGPSGNRYSVNGEVLTAVGRTVPDAVSQVLPISELNTQTQYDPPFLLSMTPAEVTRRLNQVVRLDVIDRAIKRVDQLEWNVNRDTKTRMADLEAAQNELEQYEGLDKVGERIAEVQRLDRQLAESTSLLLNLETLLSRITRLNEQLDTLDRELEVLERVDGLLELQKAIEEPARELAGLSKALADHSTTAASLRSRIRMRQIELDGIECEFASTMPDVCPLCASVRVPGMQRRTRR